MAANRASTSSISPVDLFGEPIAPRQPKPRTTLSGERSEQVLGQADVVEPAASRETQVSLARQLPGTIRLGTSSWSFPGWRGLVYADRRYTESKLSKEGLKAYAQHPLLQTVSLDRTFYAPLAEEEFARLARQVPAPFCFIVKAPQAVTSAAIRDESGQFSESPFFLDPTYVTDSFIAPCSGGLASNLGVMVFQFPPLGYRVTQAPDGFINRLYRFLSALPPGLPYAVEIRDPELLTPRFFKCLQTTRVSFCVASHARMPSPREQLRIQSMTIPDELQEGPMVARWSLHAGYKYEDAKARYFPFDRLVDEDFDSREALATAALAATRQGRPTLIAINNKAEGSAPLSVEALAALIVEMGSR